MLKFLKKKSESAPTSKVAVQETTAKPSFFSRLKNGLTKTRSQLTESVSNLFLGKKVLDQSLIDELEIILLSADVGVDTTNKLIRSLTQKLARKELDNPEAAFKTLKEEMRQILAPRVAQLPTPLPHKPYVILLVGINGAGKTTSIGKLAHHFKTQGLSVLLAAGDTFRAAAIEQLQAWGNKNGVPVISQAPGADTAAVVFDAMEAAKARHIDVLIADTAGRLHTQAHLMAELKKIKRVLAKKDADAPHEIWLTLDATLGQNAKNQVKEFHEAMGITGILLTKLDGTAKGGIIFSLADQFPIPLRFIGIGEKIDDLRPFDADNFIEALFNT